jgi:DNA-binding MarR family transcriptional regulator
LQENSNKKMDPIGKILQSTANRFRRLGDENLLKQNVTLSQLRVLAFVSKRKENFVYQRDLESVFQIRRSSVAGILKNMEKSGILIREDSMEDARVKRILLTDKGKELDRDLRHFLHSLEEDMLCGFSDEEKESLRSMLLRMNENLEQIERKRS